MRKLRLKAPSPGLIVASVALFAALGGTSYAALANGSVGTNQLRNKAVTNAKLGPQSVGTAKIRPNAVGTSQIGNNAVGLGQLGVTTVSTSANVNNNDKGTVTATCPTGSQALDGGGGFAGVPNLTFIANSQSTGQGWVLEAWNLSGATRTLTLRVVCFRQ
jgi:hypothetical protein